MRTICFQRILSTPFQTLVKRKLIIFGSHVTVGAQGSMACLGVFGKMSGIDCRRFLRSPHPLPLLFIFCTPSQFRFLHVSFFLQSLPVLFPLLKFLEMPVGQATQIHPRLHCTFDVIHFGIDTTWQTGDVKERFSFIYNWSANQRNYSTS